MIILQIPEERVPWEPTKKPIGRVRSKSVPVRKSEPLPSIIDQLYVSSSKPTSSKLSGNAKMNLSKDIKKINTKEPQSIVLTRGCLKLSLNFPSDAMVKYRDRTSETFLMRGICYCKNAPVQVF